MFGLVISKEAGMHQAEMERLAQAQLIPLGGFTQEKARGFHKQMPRDEFLRLAIAKLLQPGEPLPMAGLMEHLSAGDAWPGNVIRKYVCLQLSLLPYLRVQREVVPLEGCFCLGKDLLIAPLGEDGRVEACLPPGVWTELATGECFTGTLRRMRGLNEMPVLARENALIPIGVEDRRSDGDDADRVTLHWFQPRGEAMCVLGDGTAYRAWEEKGGYRAESGSGKPWHLIVHHRGEEILVK